jgi:ribose transport system permease protein
MSMQTDTGGQTGSSESGALPRHPTKGGGTIRPSRERALDFTERFGLVILLVAEVLLFSFLPGTGHVFATSANFNNIVTNQSVLALIVLASIVPLLTGQFDLSVAALLGVSGVVLVECTNKAGMGLGPAIVVTLIFGLVVGLVNGLLVAYVGVNAFIGTLGTSTVLYGLATAVAATPIVQIPGQLTTFGTATWLGLPSMLYVMVAFAAVLYWMLDFTPYGRRLTAIGSSVAAARLVGINVRRTVLSSYLISGLVAAAAGVFEVAISGSANGTVGQNFLLPALAAAFLGATCIRPGRFNILGALVAIFFLASAVTGLTYAGLAAWIQDVFNGLALVVGVGLSALLQQHRGGRETV